MRLESLIKLSLVLWFAAETLVFVLVAQLIGVPEALLLAFLTSLFGWTQLKRTGASAMVKLRATLNGRRIVDGNGRHVLDDTLAGFGALALLMPGFLSDAIGLVLAVPQARDRAAKWIEGGRFAKVLQRGRSAAPTGPATIDLEPGDWERTGPSQGPMSRY